MIEVLHFADSNKGACYKYRVATPLQCMNQSDELHGRYSDRWEAQLLNAIDIFSFQRNSTKEAIQIIHSLFEHNKPIVYDIDDDILHIPETNPVYRLIAQSPGVLVNQLYGIRYATAITVTNQKLKDIYSVINPNVHILPNCVNVDEWKKVPKILKRNRTCKIFWGGSPTHNCDLEIVRPVLKRISEEFGKKVEFYFMGVDENIEDFPVTDVPFGKYTFFQSIMASCDIGIAPMADNLFNLGKSDLRLKELGMASLPIVASCVGEYSRRDSGALLCKTTEDWYKALTTLINDKEQRTLRAKESNAWAKKWDIKNHIHLWTNLYEGMLDEYERGSVGQVITVQGSKRPPHKTSSSPVRVGGSPLDRNSVS